MAASSGVVLGGVGWFLALVLNHGGGPGLQEPGSRSACNDCHRFPARTSHPIGVSVGKAVELPLDVGGGVTCTTCHDPGAHYGQGVLGSALRLPTERLCRTCHEESRTMTPVEHGIAVGRAHFAPTSPQFASGGLDTLSRDCVGCHDGSVAKGHGPELPIGDAASSHPVGVRYEPNSRSGRKSHLRPRQSLPPQVQLPGDTVGCVSCHTPYSGDAAMLTVPIKLSALCFACHDM